MIWLTYEIFDIANIRHAASRTCAEPEFRLNWMKLCSSDNHYLCVNVGLSPSNCFICFNESPFSDKKLLFISSFVIKIFKFLSWILGHIRKTVWLERRLISNFMTSQPSLQTITIHVLPNISRSKGSQTMKLGQVIEYNKRNIFLQKSFRKRCRETRSRPLFVFEKPFMR